MDPVHRLGVVHIFPAQQFLTHATASRISIASAESSQAAVEASERREILIVGEMDGTGANIAQQEHKQRRQCLMRVFVFGAREGETKYLEGLKQWW